MPEAKFVLKEPNTRQKTLVYLFFNFDYQRLKYSTKISVSPKFWNAKKQRIKESADFPSYKEYNQRLNDIESAIDRIYYQLINQGDQITPTKLRDALNHELNGTKPNALPDLITWIKAEILIMEQDHKRGSIQVYNTLVKHLTEFSKRRKYKLTFNSISLEFYEQFRDYLLNEKKLLTNTFGKQVKTLKTFLNLATEKGVNTNLTYKSRIFKGTQEDIDHIYLSVEDLKLLTELDLKSKKYLDRVRDLFLIGCYTGLRFSDFTQLKPENLEKTATGYVFNVKTVKTGERVVIPVKPLVKKIWDKYDGLLPRAISNQKMNEYLKELGKLAGIDYTVTIKKTSGNKEITYSRPKYEHISSHTARRTFATNAYLAGIPAISIMKFTGHRTDRSFMKYIKVSQERNADLLKNHPYFN